MLYPAVRFLFCEVESELETPLKNIVAQVNIWQPFWFGCYFVVLQYIQWYRQDFFAKQPGDSLDRNNISIDNILALLITTTMEVVISLQIQLNAAFLHW